MNETQQQEYLTFRLGGEIYAVDVGFVCEVLDLPEVTKVPQTPEFMLGVINLRGSVVPVIDMRQKFGLEKAEKTRDSCVVVLDIDMDGEKTVVGALADSVQEVLELSADQIEPPPRIGTRLKLEFIEGIGKRGDEFLIVLDINKVFSAEELVVVQGAVLETPADQQQEVLQAASV